MKCEHMHHSVKVIIGIMVFSQLNFGPFLPMTLRAHYCWDPVYHPGLTTMCECDPVAETACTAVKEIMKDGWISCPAAGTPPGSEFEGACSESSQNVGSETDCDSDIDTDGVEDCLAAIAAAGISTAGLAAPTVITQVVGFLGLIVSLYSMNCDYCDLTMCTQDPDTMALISRSVVSNEPMVCGSQGG